MSESLHKDFHQKLLSNIDTFVHRVYDATTSFPKDEIFGATSQIRRSALSVALNYTEGYARVGKKELGHFLRIAYASLKEALYIVHFARARNWINESTSEKLTVAGDEIGRMLWSTFSRL